MARVPRNLEAVKIPEGWLRIESVQDGVNPVGYVESVFLAPSAAQQIPIPATATFATIVGNVDYYLAWGTNPTATIPVATTTDGSACALNPINRFFGRGECANLSIISPNAGIVTITFWSS